MSPKRQNRLFQKLTLQHCRKIVFEYKRKTKCLNEEIGQYLETRQT